MSYNGDDDPGFASVAAEVFKLDAMMGTRLFLRPLTPLPVVG